MSTPLYDALVRLSAENPLRLHMPGHKGRMSGLFHDLAKIDFTEITPTGNLYTGEGPIAQAEALFAQAAGAREALFFTCGSTQGIQTMLAAAVGMGGTLLLDRCCHKSIYHTMGLLDISPVYPETDYLPGTSLPAPITPAQVQAALALHPEIRALLLTSPSYYGVCTDLAPLAEECHRHGVFLLVDQAHGAHFPFVGLPTAVMQGADLCVVSAHKTLPAMGSSALLYVGEAAPWDSLRLKKLSSLFATTSPSYPIMASIDYARALLEHSDAYAQAAMLTTRLRHEIIQKTPFSALLPEKGISLDPCRLTIDLQGMPGWEADRLLQQKGIYMELSDERYLVAILTCCDGEADAQRLLRALKELPCDERIPSFSPPPSPVIRCSIRDAMFGPQEKCPLGAAAGRISAEIIAPYPPGQPIIAPGEEIMEKHIAYLQKKSYNIDEEVYVLL